MATLAHKYHKTMFQPTQVRLKGMLPEIRREAAENNMCMNEYLYSLVANRHSKECWHCALKERKKINKQKNITEKNKQLSFRFGKQV